MTATQEKPAPSPALDDTPAEVPQAPLSRLLTVLLLAGLNNAPFSGARLILPMIAVGMGIAASWIGVLISLFTVAPLFLTVTFGRWVDRVGPLTPMLFSTLLIVAASALFAFFPTKTALFLCAALIGAGVTFSHIACTRAVGDLGPPSVRARNLGYLVLNYSLFQFLGPMIAGTTYDLGGQMAAVLSLGGFALLALIVLQTPFHTFKRFAKEVRPVTPGRSRDLWRVPTLPKWLLSIGVFGALQSIYPFVISLHAMATGLSASHAGITLGSYALGAMASRASVSVILRHMRGENIVTLALLGGALVYIGLPFLDQLLPLIIFSIALGFACGIGMPIALTLTYDVAPPARVNEAIGMGVGITTLLQTTLPLGLGLLASGLGASAMAWALAVIMLLCAGLTRTGGK